MARVAQRWTSRPRESKTKETCGRRDGDDTTACVRQERGREGRGCRHPRGPSDHDTPATCLGGTGDCTSRHWTAPKLQRRVPTGPVTPASSPLSGTHSPTTYRTPRDSRLKGNTQRRTDGEGGSSVVILDYTRTDRETYRQETQT